MYTADFLKFVFNSDGKYLSPGEEIVTNFLGNECMLYVYQIITESGDELTMLQDEMEMEELGRQVEDIALSPFSGNNRQQTKVAGISLLKTDMSKFFAVGKETKFRLDVASEKKLASRDSFEMIGGLERQQNLLMTLLSVALKSSSHIKNG